MPLNGDPNAAPSVTQQPFPCKGHHIDISGPGGKPAAEWNAGQRVTLSLFDSTNTTDETMHNPGASHSGGSCQVAFSYDKGETWVVVHTWEGNCPRVGNPGTVTNVYDVNQDYTFTIPKNFPTGHRVIFAWVWINASGNREYYMSCSSVNILGVGGTTEITPAGPPLLVVNLDPTRLICYTREQTSVLFPQKYTRDTPIQRAPIALNLEYLPAPDPDYCGSDNLALRKLIRNP